MTSFTGATYFKDIFFGQASAELEGTYYPELLLNGFLDPWNVIDEVIKGHKFLFLGYKGSGKSAIGEHLRLSAEAKHDLFVSNIFLSDFPYGDFERIITGNAEPESRYPSAWSWILILSLLGSFSKDSGAEFDNIFTTSIDALEKIGLLPAINLKETVIASAKPKYKAKLPPLLEIEVDGNQNKVNDLGFLRIIDHLKNVIFAFKSPNKHLIVIDGLDDILLQKEVQYQSIAALILEATRINMLLFQENINAKIIIFCRTELYEKLPGANKNKIRQDLSIELNWYHNPHNPSSSKLVHLVNKRAQLKYPSVKDIFLKFFPRTIYEDNLLLTHFLHHTRHTPRDFIQLMSHIQKCSPRIHGKIDIKQIVAGISLYSSTYFYPEIIDELVGYIDKEDAKKLLEAISKVKKRIFSIKELSDSCQSTDILKKNDLYRLLDLLFSCSAIGNIERGGRKTYYSFKYRNRHSHFNPEQSIILHQGLWRALNVK